MHNMTVALSPFWRRAARSGHVQREGSTSAERPDQWRAQLGDDAMRSFCVRVTRERAFTSPEPTKGPRRCFHCKGCDQALYSSKTNISKVAPAWPQFPLRR